jgi:hypothetical protein
MTKPRHDDAALEQFERWMRLRGVVWDDAALHIRPCHKKGERLHYAVFACDTLAVDLPVITIPKVTRRIISLAGAGKCRALVDAVRTHARNLVGQTLARFSDRAGSARGMDRTRA